MLENTKRNFVVNCLLICLCIMTDLARSQHHDAQISTAHCSHVIETDSLVHTPPVATSKGLLTSSVFYTGTNGEACRLDSSNSLRIELPRMTPVSDIGVRSNGKIHARLVRNSTSHESIQFDCPMTDSDETGTAYFKCHNSKGEYENWGIVANAIELTADGVTLISLQPNETWMYIIQKGNDYPYCRQPGLYSTQKLLAESNTVYKYGEKVSYECNVNPCRQPSCTNERTCTEKGWSGGPPRCVSGNSPVHTLFPEQGHAVKETASEAEFEYRLKRTLFRITGISVHLTCKETKEAVYRDDLCRRNPITDISLESLLPQLNVTWVPPKQVFTFIYTENKYNFSQTTYRPVVNQEDSDGQVINCRDCVVKMKLNFDSKSMSWPKVRQIEILGWDRSEFETHFWMVDGCPPIDPYTGMPDEYANEAAMNPDKLNEKLREQPCAYGYRHNSTAAYKTNPMRCVDNTWTGEMPQCIPLTCKTPPSIKNGAWRYRSDESFVEVVYSCEDSLVPSNGQGVARCNHMTNEWVKVPSCIKAPAASRLLPDGSGVQGCPPIDPYVGMPDEYADEEYNEREILNENLRENPCREGYWHNRTLQYEESPMQCVENSWTGEKPQCIQITCQTPPRIKNGTWRYRDNGSFLEVVYSCDEAFVLSGDDIARCNNSSTEWEGAPSCIEQLHFYTGNSVPLWAALIAVVLCSLPVTLLVYLRRKTKNSNLATIERGKALFNEKCITRKNREPAKNGYLHPRESHYYEEIDGYSPTTRKSGGNAYETAN